MSNIITKQIRCQSCLSTSSGDLCYTFVLTRPLVSFFDAQSTLRRPEVHTFAWKLQFCIVRMGDNDMRSTHTTTNKIGSKFNTVLTDKSDIQVCLSDLYLEYLFSFTLVPESRWWARSSRRTRLLSG